jgi:hypothetical protein
MADPPKPFRTASIAPMSPVHGPSNDGMPAIGTRNPLIGLASVSGVMALFVLYGQIVGF